jgi:hypothetical protein
MAQGGKGRKLCGLANADRHNVKKYYPETIETAKGHLNQTRKNVRSTRHKMETCDTSQLQGKKVRDVYTTAYDVRETMFSDQTVGQYPTRSQRGNKYIMVMVEIDSNAILVKPMKSRKDAEMIRAYDALLLRLKRAGAGIVPKKHVLDNLAGNVADMSARHGDVGNFFQKRHVVATHDTQKEALTHSFCVLFCRHAPAHHIMPPKKKKRGGGGGGPTTTTAAAAASAADDDNDMVSLPPMSKKVALAKTRAIDAARAKAVAGATAAAAAAGTTAAAVAGVAATYAAANDDDDDDDDVSEPGLSKKDFIAIMLREQTLQQQQLPRLV